MSVVINDNSVLHKEAVLKLKKSDIDLKKEEKIIYLSKTLNLKGFRKGFIPYEVILSRFEKHIDSEVQNELVYRSLLDFFKENNINYVRFPILKKMDTIESEGLLIFYFDFEIYPKIDIIFDNLSIKKYVSSIEDMDIDDEILRLRNFYGSWIEVSSVSLNDKVTFKILDKFNLNCILFCEDILVNQDYSSINNFLNFILNKNLNFDYEVYYSNSSLLEGTDLEANCYFKIISVKRFVASSLNESFYSKLNFDPSLFDFRSFIKSNLNDVLNNISNKLFKKAVNNLLLKSFIFDVPTVLVEEKISYFKKQNVDYKLPDLLNEIKLDLILSEIIKKFNIHVSKDEVSIFFNKESLLDESTYSYIEKELYLEKIFSLLLSKLNFVEEKVKFKDLFILGKDL